MALLSGPIYCSNQWEFQAPFEAGIRYMIRYIEEESRDGWGWTDNDIYNLAVHLAHKKPWRDIDEWQEFIKSNLERWRNLKED